jgi:hypothetical protein
VVACALSQQYSAALLAFGCHHSPGIRCSHCNVVRFDKGWYRMHIAENYIIHNGHGVSLEKPHPPLNRNPTAPPKQCTALCCCGTVFVTWGAFTRWWRQYAPLKRQSTPRLHGATSQKALVCNCNVLQLPVPQHSVSVKVKRLSNTKQFYLATLQFNCLHLKYSFTYSTLSFHSFHKCMIFHLI